MTQLAKMAEKGDSSDDEHTIAEDVVVTKYKMAGDMANRTLRNVCVAGNLEPVLIRAHLLMTPKYN